MSVTSPAETLSGNSALSQRAKSCVVSIQSCTPQCLCPRPEAKPASSVDMVRTKVEFVFRVVLCARLSETFSCRGGLPPIFMILVSLVTVGLADWRTLLSCIIYLIQ
ncbi:hypothetical protein LIA77_02271 [Sarocladium implicatum]|nr:hypothetical protein LIA77_02271 [Sarocladium implicatum]